jgi:hypothetical protein
MDYTMDRIYVGIVSDYTFFLVCPESHSKCDIIHIDHGESTFDCAGRNHRSTLLFGDVDATESLSYINSRELFKVTFEKRKHYVCRNDNNRKCTQYKCGNCCTDVKCRIHCDARTKRYKQRHEHH